MKSTGFLKRSLQPFLLCAAAAVFCVVASRQDWSVLRSLRAVDILICSILIIIRYVFCGVQYRISLEKLGCRLTLADILFYPFMKSFWGIIIPVQGAVIFGMFYLKSKYSFQVTKSAATIIFLYLFNIVFGSLAGLEYCISMGEIASLMFFMSLFALFSPLYLWVLYRILNSDRVNLPLPEKMKNMLMTFFNSLGDLFADFKGIMVLLGCQILRQCCSAAAFVHIASCMGYPVHWRWGYLVAVSQELSIIFKFTPGNVGTNEAVSAFVSNLTGVSVEAGFIAALFCTALSMLLFAVIGGGGCCIVMRKYISFRNVIAGRG